MDGSVAIFGDGGVVRLMVKMPSPTVFVRVLQALYRSRIDGTRSAISEKPPSRLVSGTPPRLMLPLLASQMAFVYCWMLGAGKQLASVSKD